MNESEVEPESDDRPEGQVEDLAADFCARRAEGESVDRDAYLEQLTGEADKLEFSELVDGAELALGSLPGVSDGARVLSGRYRLEDEIGAGGMGRVFRAWDLELERFVAIKVLSALDVGDPEREQLLIKESKLLAALQHPNIVTVHETGRDGELVYVAMELVDGVSLATVIDRIRARLSMTRKGVAGSTKEADQIHGAIDRPLPSGWVDLLDSRSFSRSVASVMLQVTRTIEAAHAGNIVHRDLKPSNIMLIGGANPVVLDFGLAGSTDRVEGAITQGLYGTVSYIAPEQARSQRVGADRRTDIYQLGLLLYEFLTLERAFSTGAIGEVLERIQRGDFPAPRDVDSNIPHDLEAICLKALEVAPDRRYQDVQVMSEDLECFLSQDGIPSAVKGSSTRRVVRKSRIVMRRHPVVSALAGMAIVGALAWMTSEAMAGNDRLQADIFAGIPGESEVRLIKDGDPVSARESLGIVVDSSEPRTVYALSLYSDLEESDIKCVKPMRPWVHEYVGERSGEWGVQVKPGTSHVWCSRVEETDSMEGLMFYVSAGRVPLLDSWFSVLENETAYRAEGFLSLEDARLELRGLMEGGASRGSAIPMPSEAEKVRWRELDLQFDDPEEEYWRSAKIWFDRVECVVKGSPGGE